MKRFEEWTIAYRKIGERGLLLHNQEVEFRIIKNTWRYWCADPHLLNYGGHTYVFAELYDRVLRRGVIGCCEITDSSHTPWRVVLRMPWHLSYPHIFVYNNDVYLIPESYGNQEIAVYKAVSFPDKWEKVKTIMSGCIAVDSTLLTIDKKWWMQTLEYVDDQPFFHLYLFEDGMIKDLPYVIAKDDKEVRPAGKIFWHNEEMIRPAQDCVESYGSALNFYQVEKIAKDDYRERLIAKIQPESIRSDSDLKPQGIHTYNVNDEYEVIDLKEYKIDLWYYPMRIILYAWRKLRRLLGGR